MELCWPEQPGVMDEVVGHMVVSGLDPTDEGEDTAPFGVLDGLLDPPADMPMRVPFSKLPVEVNIPAVNGLVGVD